jgi:hypothetical protein
MLAYRLAEQCGEADVDALMERTPVTRLMEWAAFWGIQADQMRGEEKGVGPPPEDTEMTPEIAESLVTGFRGVLGVKAKKTATKEATE